MVVLMMVDVRWRPSHGLACCNVMFMRRHVGKTTVAVLDMAGTSDTVPAKVSDSEEQEA
jgi:hypothetical protein